MAVADARLLRLARLCLHADDHDDHDDRDDDGGDAASAAPLDDAGEDAVETAGGAAEDDAAAARRAVSDHHRPDAVPACDHHGPRPVPADDAGPRADPLASTRKGPSGVLGRPDDADRAAAELGSETVAPCDRLVVPGGRIIVGRA